jgi:hypothetical protein
MGAKSAIGTNCGSCGSFLLGSRLSYFPLLSRTTWLVGWFDSALARLDSRWTFSISRANFSALVRGL